MFLYFFTMFNCLESMHCLTYFLYFFHTQTRGVFNTELYFGKIPFSHSLAIASSILSSRFVDCRRDTILIRSPFLLISCFRTWCTLYPNGLHEYVFMFLYYFMYPCVIYKSKHCSVIFRFSPSVVSSLEKINLSYDGFTVYACHYSNIYLQCI